MARGPPAVPLYYDRGDVQRTHLADLQARDLDHFAVARHTQILQAEVVPRTHLALVCDLLSRAASPRACLSLFAIFMPNTLTILSPIRQENSEQAAENLTWHGVAGTPRRRNQRERHLLLVWRKGGRFKRHDPSEYVKDEAKDE